MENKDTQFWDQIASKLHGELEPDENLLFEKELDNPQNERLVKDGTRIHQGLTELKGLHNSDKEGSWRKIEKHVRVKIVRTYAQGFLKYAAILLVAFVSALYFQNQFKMPEQGIQYAEIEVLYGQTGHLFLFDGTEVWLNSGTKFKYPNKFNQNERNVFMEGEAFFKVAPNKKLPFKVKTGKLEVEVLGTSFNVSAYKDEPNQSVFLVEGKVRINNPDGKPIGEMIPGQMAEKTEGVDKLTVKNADPYFYTSWKDGKVIFSAEKLGDIAKKMERWYNVEIRFENESLKDYRFTGAILRIKPIDQTIMAMEMLAPIRFNYLVRTTEKNVITIVKK